MNDWELRKSVRGEQHDDDDDDDDFIKKNEKGSNRHFQNNGIHNVQISTMSYKIYYLFLYISYSPLLFSILWELKHVNKNKTGQDKHWIIEIDNSAKAEHRWCVLTVMLCSTSNMRRSLLYLSLLGAQFNEKLMQYRQHLLC